MTTQSKPIDFFYTPTPNGRKITIMLEELGVPYTINWINIGKGDQFTPEFLAISPNNKIPAIVDPEGPGGQPISIFESGAILVYLAEKFGAFLPTAPSARAECLSWLFWQMGSAPYIGGGFGHFYAYAPEKIEYGINRYAMEVKRLLDVLNRHLSTQRYLCGDEYTIADMANYAWYGALVAHNIYEAAEFLDVGTYTHVLRWVTDLEARPAVQRGRRVNKSWGPEEERLIERHSARDFGGPDRGQNT